MSDIKVSIIIPVYNVEKYLEECLNSAVNQTLKEIEIICVNDGSTDSSLEILKKYEEKYNNITIINQENKGLSGARNSGLNKAKGKYIYFFDSDDIIDLNTCKECYLLCEDERLDILTFDAEVFYDNMNVKSNYKFNYDRKNILRHDVMRGYDYYKYCILNNVYRSSACLQIFNKEFLNKNELYFYEGILHEDELFTIKATLLSNRISYIDKQFFKRRVRENSIMTKEKGYKNSLGYYTVAKELYEFYNENLYNLDIEISQILLKSIFNLYISSYNIISKANNNECKILKDKIRYEIKSEQNMKKFVNYKTRLLFTYPSLYGILSKIKNKK